MQGCQVHTILKNIPTLSLIRPVAKAGKTRKIHTEPSSVKGMQENQSGRLKALAEAVILQAMEDLWSKTHRARSVEFFTGEGFRRYAAMAGMGTMERLRLLKTLRPKKEARSKSGKGRLASAV